MWLFDVLYTDLLNLLEITMLTNVFMFCYLKCFLCSSKSTYDIIAKVINLCLLFYFTVNLQFHEIWNHDEIQQLYGIYHNHNNYDHDNNNNHNHSQDSTTCTADSRIKCCGILHSASDVSTILYSSLLEIQFTA